MDLQHLARTRTSCFAAHPSRSNYLVIFVPLRHRASGHVAAGGLQSHLHRPHLLTPS